MSCLAGFDLLYMDYGLRKCKVSFAQKKGQRHGKKKRQNLRRAGLHAGRG